VRPRWTMQQAERLLHGFALSMLVLGIDPFA
jgi:hypothetical protein